MAIVKHTPLIVIKATTLLSLVNHTLVKLHSIYKSILKTIMIKLALAQEVKLDANQTKMIAKNSSLLLHQITTVNHKQILLFKNSFWIKTNLLKVQGQQHLIYQRVSKMIRVQIEANQINKTTCKTREF